MATKKTSVDVTGLKNRIKEVCYWSVHDNENERLLETQLSDYKKRLDDLRKAKNTTILKREREVVEIGAPQLGCRGLRLSQSSAPDVNEELNVRHQRELNDLRKKHEAELEVVKKNSQCNHEEELTQLRLRLTGVEADNAALVVENEDLTDRVKSLLHELSVKEARWCETEEQLKLKIKMEWGEKYQEWMESTEKKIEELQEANQLLRRMVRKPEGSDPSGQDKS